MSNNKNKYIGCRVDDDFLADIKKIMDLFKMDNFSEFNRMVLERMINNAKERRLIG